MWGGGLKSVKNQGDYSQFKISGIFFEKKWSLLCYHSSRGGYLSGVTKKFSGKILREKYE
jgi:hypothetical protein